MTETCFVTCLACLTAPLQTDRLYNCPSAIRPSIGSSLTTCLISILKSQSMDSCYQQSSPNASIRESHAQSQSWTRSALSSRVHQPEHRHVNNMLFESKERTVVQAARWTRCREITRKRLQGGVQSSPSFRRTWQDAAFSRRTSLVSCS